LLPSFGGVGGGGETLSYKLVVFFLFFFENEILLVWSLRSWFLRFD
jgi:hypothetical protein